MSNKQHILAIDFGTANSYFCLSRNDKMAPTPIQFQSGIDSIASAVLYQRNQDPLVGTVAIEEWGELSPEVRRESRLVTHFKPDIAASDQARQTAVDFLEGVIRQAQQQHIKLNPQDHDVIFGIPSEASDEFKNTLKSIAAQAHYGEIRMIDEPIGALLYHLWHHDLSPRETFGGVLVIDFGGGTCDFAYMQTLHCQHSWGDMLYGGRLFDDLFFQWFLSQNPEAYQAMAANGDVYFVHWEECRQLKEHFSRRMSLNKSATVTKKMHYGVMQDLTWQEFIKRAENYKPSDFFLEYLQNTRHHLSSDKLAGQPVNLIKWFNEILLQGLQKTNLKPDQINKVIFTGGSSQWPFVVEQVTQLLTLTSEQVLVSNQPYVTVGEGLAILPALQQDHLQTRQKLEAGLDDFFNHTVKSLIKQRIATLVDIVAKEITIELYDEQIQGLFYNFRNHGGSIENLEQHIQITIEQFAPRLKEIVSYHIQKFNHIVSEDIQQAVIEYVEKAGVKYVPEEFGLMQIPITDPKNPEKLVLQNPYEQLLAGLTAVIIPVIVAHLCGGGGIALIASGPIGAIVGAIIGLAIAYFTILYGRDKARAYTKSIPIPAWVVRMFLSKNKVAKLLQENRRKFTQQMRDSIFESLHDALDRRQQEIRDLIDKEIKALDAITQLG